MDIPDAKYDFRDVMSPILAASKNDWVVLVTTNLLKKRPNIMSDIGSVIFFVNLDVTFNVVDIKG